MSKRILILDEDKNRRVNIQSKVRTHDYDTEFAQGGFHAIHLLEKESFDLMIIFEDAHDMGVMEILSLARTIKEDKEEFPIIIVERRAQQEEVLSYFDVGVNEYIVFNDKFYASLFEKLKKFNTRRLGQK